MEVSRKGCFFSVLIVAVLLLGAGWLLGAFMVAPVHCSAPECEQWAIQLDRSVLSSGVGVGCLVLAGLNIRPRVFLLLGVAVLGSTALAGITHEVIAAVVAIDILLIAAVGGWFLAGWLDAWQ